MSERPSWQNEEREPRAHYRSLFWPILFIGAGVILLLANMGVLPAVTWWNLLRLWPLLLIVAGLDILLSGRAPAVGAILGVLIVGGVAALMLLAPDTLAGSRGLSVGNVNLFPEVSEMKHGRFVEELKGAKSARVELDLGPLHTTVRELDDSPNLIEAELDYAGEIRFSASGDAERRIALDEEGSNWRWPLNLDGKRYKWEIGLAQDMPLDLYVDASSGSSELNLSRLTLKRFEMDASSGSATVDLPGGEYSVAYDGSSGSVKFNAPAEADVEMNLSMSSGSVQVNVDEGADCDLRLTHASSGSLIVRAPRDAGLRVEVRHHSSGRVVTPQGLPKIKEGDHPSEGVYESANYAGAAHRVTVLVEDMSSGSVTIDQR